MPPASKTRYLDALLIACSAVFVVFAAGVIIYFSNHLPLYIDEVSWNFTSGRSIIDHYNMTFCWPQCGSSFSQKLPWLWLIPAWVTHLAYFPAHGVMYLRLVNMACFFSWLLIWLLILKRIFALGTCQLVVACAAILAFFALDHVVLLMVMARPEQAELLQAGIIVALAVYSPSIALRRAPAVVSTLLFIATALQLGYTNPREIVFLPMCAFAGFYFFKNLSRSPFCGALFTALIAFIMVFSYEIWSARIECADADFRDLMRQRDIFPFHLLRQSPGDFVLAAYESFTESLRSNLAAFAEPYWLGTDGAHSRSVDYFYFTAKLPRMALYFLTLYMACRQFFLRLTSSGGEVARPEYNVMGACALVSVSGLLAFQGIIHPFTVCVLNVPLLLFSFVLVLGSSRLKPDRRAYVHLPVFVLLGLGTANLAGFFSLYPHPDEYSNIVEGRVISVSMRALREKLPLLPSLVKICGIDERTGNHLVLDTQTYFPFRHSFEPYELYFATDQEADYDPKLMHFTVQHFDQKAFMQFLARNRSTGIIGDCRNFPDMMRAQAKEQGGFCCISEEMIRRLAAQ